MFLENRITKEISNLIEILDQLVMKEGITQDFDPQRLRCEFRWALTLYQVGNSGEDDHCLAERIFKELNWSEDDELHYWNTSGKFQDPVIDYEWPQFYKRMSESWSRVIFLCMTLSYHMAKLTCSDRNREKQSLLRNVAPHLRGVKEADFEILVRAIDDDKPLPSNYSFEREKRPQSEIENELENSIFGQRKLKEELKLCMSYANNSLMRIKRGQKVPELSHHLILKGNPGTGKTTVARLLGKFFYEIGILKSQKFIEVSRSDLIGGYIGQTAKLTRAKLTEALDGVIFIDEAYALVASDSPSDFGPEAIAELVKFMEDHRNRLVVVMAGYPDEMDKLLDKNPGLRSRFNSILEFEDYTPEELYLILEKFAKDGGFHIVPSIKNKWSIIIPKIAQDVANGEDGNARYIRNLYGKALLRQARRVEPDSLTMPINEFNEIKAEDLFPSD